MLFSDSEGGVGIQLGEGSRNERSHHPDGAVPVSCLSLPAKTPFHRGAGGPGNSFSQKQNLTQGVSVGGTLSKDFSHHWKDSSFPEIR